MEVNNYYPFGLLHDYTATSQNAYQYKFLGQELQETGFYDMNARFYMPDLGIFGQHDPLSGKTLDPYGYAYQNPIFFSDPTGLEGDPVPGSSGTGNPQAIGTAASPIDVGEVILTGVSKTKQMDSSLSYMGIQSLNNYQASKYRLNEAINNCRECKQLESVEKGLFIGIPLTLATGGIGGLALSGETTAISLLLKASGSAGMQYTATGDINIMSVVGDTFGAWGTGEALGGLTELSYEKLRNGAPAFRTVFDGGMSWSEGISNVGIALIGKGITNANTLTKVGAQGLNKGIVNVNNFLIGTAAYRAAQVNAEEIKKNK